ncbi:hypothetical protein [Methylobacterium soli]|jgi:hypothetical protein|uniref:Uncharacterized protein n=1 Tax=Methylobacterium soli TaxID=553447 RepID=A0A6L3SRJ0_9HYPH|nr:hypothetical protein [Methylobacterium soli]KAB1069554.1 hypothetical protein F6X53_30930 [Methylobacterium soli]GJE45882.1 hypothetical protein AEGHOMDF_5082 [Methylobacterium soli]
MAGTEACADAIGTLKRQVARLNDIMRDIDDGRWWPSDAFGHDDAESVTLHAKRIEESVDEIARIVGAMKD